MKPDRYVVVTRFIRTDGRVIVNVYTTQDGTISEARTLARKIKLEVATQLTPRAEFTADVRLLHVVGADLNTVITE